MSEPRKRAAIATKLLFFITNLIILLYKILLYINISVNDILLFWTAVSFLSMVSVWLIIVAFTGWFNIDIFKLLGMKERRFDELF